jgi:hypothetical protein
MDLLSYKTLEALVEPCSLPRNDCTYIYRVLNFQITNNGVSLPHERLN